MSLLIQCQINTGHLGFFAPTHLAQPELLGILCILCVFTQLDRIREFFLSF